MQVPLITGLWAFHSVRGEMSGVELMDKYSLSAVSILRQCDGWDRILSLKCQEESFVEGNREHRVVITVLWSDQKLGRIADERSRGGTCGEKDMVDT